MGLMFTEWDRALRSEKEWFPDRAEGIDLILGQIADKVEAEKRLTGVAAEADDDGSLSVVEPPDLAE